jgi:hypothetical protein
MSPLRDSIKLLRYLCVWRVNSSLVRVPHLFHQELPWVLGQLIAEHLPTREARPWNKHLERWREYLHQNAQANRYGRRRPEMPEAIWPFQAVFFPYPGKHTYGRYEPILWELKLLGNSADHLFFLEVILPAMEAAGYTKDSRWHQRNTLWGRFDIDAVYVARGREWDPLVENGEVDLRYVPTPRQWTEAHLDIPDTSFTELHWITPFALMSKDGQSPDPGAPSMSMLLQALIVRLQEILASQHKGTADLWNWLDEAQASQLRTALAQAEHVQLCQHTLEPAGVPGQRQGVQTFSPIPASLLPYLDLAAMLHLGKGTQFGYGSFVMM